MLIQVQAVKAGSGRSSARILDQFYTRPDVAERCLDRLFEAVVPPPAPCVWLEPSAGAGSFLRHLPRPRLGLDIAPRHDEVTRADFFTWRPQPGLRYVVVGNPPFGKNSSLAVRFFNRAAAFAEVVAFIVPRTFQKESLKAKLDPFMELRIEETLEGDAFEFEGEPYAVPTVFQVWERTARLRRRQSRPTRHADFEFLPAEHAISADFAFQRVGARAGLASREGLRKSPQSHYFIRVINRDIDVLTTLRGVDWNEVKWRTAGNPSIGKAELVAAYEARRGQEPTSR